MKLINILTISAFTFISFASAEDTEKTKKQAIQHPEIKPYPETLDQLERKVIVLPKLADESLYKVEIIPGKTVEVDGINRYSIGYTLKKETLKGWGYSYYKIVGKDAVISTRMGGQPNPHPEFVKGKSLIVRYNSKLPLVIYVPKGAEVKCRIWSTDGSLISAE